MPNEPEAQDKPSTEKKEWQIAVKWLNTAGFRILLIAAGLLTVALILFVVLGINDANTKTNVFIAGILTILTIVVTTVSAVSNRLMVEVMERQETEMTQARITAQEQRDAMRDQLSIMSDTLQHTRDAFEMVERPIVLVTQVDTLSGLDRKQTVANQNKYRKQRTDRRPKNPSFLSNQFSRFRVWFLLSTSDGLE